jgi:hypothetical protein
MRNAKEYLRRFTLKNRATVEQRLAAWMLERFNRDPIRAGSKA